MTEMFISFLGEYAGYIIGFYRANQSWLNILVLTYGVMLAVAHRNVVRLESYLKRTVNLDDMFQVRQHIEKEGLSEETLRGIREELRIPILASPRHFSFYRLSPHSIQKILQKKYPRSDNS